MNISRFRMIVQLSITTVSVTSEAEAFATHLLILRKRYE